MINQPDRLFISTGYNEYKRKPNSINQKFLNKIPKFILPWFGRKFTWYKQVEGEEQVSFGKPVWTMDLITVGLILQTTNNLGERTEKPYDVVSKDFDIRSAFQNEPIKKAMLFPIFERLLKKEDKHTETQPEGKFTEENLERLVKKFGKSNNQIAEDILALTKSSKNLECYTHFSTHDWVMLNWIFENKLPENFPSHPVDLKQKIDQKADDLYKYWEIKTRIEKGSPYQIIDTRGATIDFMKGHQSFPTIDNESINNSLGRAKFASGLFKFMNLTPIQIAKNRKGVYLNRRQRRQKRKAA